jgi:hypothetical protein
MRTKWKRQRAKLELAPSSLLCFRDNSKRRTQRAKLELAPNKEGKAKLETVIITVVMTIRKQEAWWLLTGVVHLEWINLNCLIYTKRHASMCMDVMPCVMCGSCCACNAMCHVHGQCLHACDSACPSHACHVLCDLSMTCHVHGPCLHACDEMYVMWLVHDIIPPI